MELDNFRGALAWALTYGNDAVLGGAIAGALRRLWMNAGLTVEGRYWTELALEAVSEIEQPHVTARLCLAMSGLSEGIRKRSASERAMQLFGEVGDDRGVARAQLTLANVLYQMGDLESACAICEKSLTALRASGTANDVASALNMRAMFDRANGKVSTAREGYAQALAAFKALGNESGVSMVLGNVAELEFRDGQPEQAVSANTESLEIDLRGRHATNIAVSYINGAAYRLALDDFEGAHESARVGLGAGRQEQNELIVAIAQQHLALVAALVGDGHRAAQLLGYVDARYGELGNIREYTEQWCYDKLLLTLRAQLSEDEIARLMCEGATWSEDQAVDEALQVVAAPKGPRSQI